MQNGYNQVLIKDFAVILSIVFLLVGLALILGGATALTDGASALARRMGVSELVVGLTVVAFGTSAPELAISLISAIDGSPELAVGNAVGSNIFNILVIVGITALVRPIIVTRSLMTNEIPLVVLSSVVLLVMANGPLLDGGATAMITRADGIILMLFFVIFMRYTFSQARTMPAGATEATAAEAAAAAEKPMGVWKAIAFVAAGLVALVGGGQLFVEGASDIARAFGVSDAVIGLTIVACGTSLPELATSVTAALKGKPGIAVGNVIGSNIFNIFLVLGASATIAPLRLGNITNIDLLTLTGASLLFWIFGWLFSERTITRAEGAVMTACYIGYIAWLVANA